jgi:hypothetical protein
MAPDPRAMRKTAASNTGSPPGAKAKLVSVQHLQKVPSWTFMITDLEPGVSLKTQGPAKSQNQNPLSFREHFPQQAGLDKENGNTYL